MRQLDERRWPLPVGEHRQVHRAVLGHHALDVVARRRHEGVAPEVGYDGRDAPSPDGRGGFETEEAPAVGGGSCPADEGLVTSGARVLSPGDGMCCR